MEESNLIKEWTDDSKIGNDLEQESIRTSTLHAKWIKILAAESMKYHKLNLEHRKLKYDLKVHIDGPNKTSQQKYSDISDERKKLKKDFNFYQENYPALADSQFELDKQQSKLRFIEEVIRSINQRTYNIKNIIEYKKFEAGF